MATYDIPGITTSVVDYSLVTPAIAGGRTPLIAGLSKFGDDKNIIEFNDQNTVKYLTGGPNYQKYGLALHYVLGALSVTGKVLFKRLLPDDATYANIGVAKDSNDNLISKSYADIRDIKYFEQNGILNHFAKARGEGYNEFYVHYEQDPITEKVYADDEGDSKYKYNFLKVTIYQKLPEGIKTIAGPLTVSLIDTDPKTNVPIVDVTTGETLFINDRIEGKNDFVNVKLIEDYIVKFKKYLNINDIIEEKGTTEVILKDIETGINYKVKADANNNLYIEATSVEGLDEVILKYYSSGAWNYVKLYVENGELKKDSTTDVGPDTPTYEKIYLTGDLNFVEVFVDSETQELVVKEFAVERATLYKKLLSQDWYFENGFDGEYIHINDQMNFNGPSEAGKQNVKQLLIDFYANNSEIREIMFPKYIYNYVVDWTSDLDVINSIINLTDSVGKAFGIFSLPLSYGADNDYKIRTEKLYQSTYNNMLYAGEWNLKHYDEFSGKNIPMPMSYYMMIKHLQIDNQESITQPVAGIVRGQLPVSNVELSYSPKTKDIEKLRHVQINTIVNETDGVYAIDQLTMYKKASKLSRINVVKVIQQMRIDLPQLLKPFIQTKETSNVVSSIESIVNDYMNKWKVVVGSANPDEIFKSVNVSTLYIPEEYKLIVSIRVVPIGTIEKIDIPIIVENQ
jgi:hypothetical protein